MLSSLVLKRLSTGPKCFILSPRGFADKVHSIENDTVPSRASVIPKTVVYNGKIYNHPWKGELEEDGGVIKRIDKWSREGKWDSSQNRPKLFLPESHEKNKMWSVYYQMHDDLPMHMRGPLDPVMNSIAKILTALNIFIIAMCIRELVFPEEWKSRFVRPWEKKHEEHH